MHVIEINRIKETAELRRKKKVSSTYGFSEILSSEIDEKEATEATANVTSAETLLFLQEINSFETPEKKTLKRADDILNQLEEFKNNLLAGKINKSALENIKNTLSFNRVETGDRRLEALIDEIELRAHVELAKYESNE